MRCAARTHRLSPTLLLYAWLTCYAPRSIAGLATPAADGSLHRALRRVGSPVAGILVAAEHDPGDAADSDLLVLTPAAILLPFVMERARSVLQQLTHASLLPGSK